MLLKPIDLARAMNCSPRSVRRAAAAGGLDHTHVGTDFRFRPETLDLVLKRGLPSRADGPKPTACPRCRMVQGDPARSEISLP